jgi:hypothetical protein
MFKKFSSILVPLTLMAAPQAPSNLKLIPHTNSVDISWSDNSENESGFKIFRDGHLILTVPQNVTSYTDAGLKAGATYKYTIKATDDELFSNAISSMEASHSKSSLHLKMNGSFTKGSHGSFFIDADNNAQTGYSNSPVKGAEYLVIDNKLYRYPDNAKGWKWDKISDSVETVFTSTAITSSIPLDMLDIGADINYISGITTADWKKNVKFPHMQKYTFVDVAGPFEVEQYPKDGLGDEKYIVYYPKNAIAKDMPVVLFLEGGGKPTKITDYEGIMKYLASRGYFVIGGETGAGYDIKNYVYIFENAINTAKDAHGLSIKRLAVMGHSQGGGDSFYVMKYFQDKGYGSDASLVLSIDGWFAFDMNQDDLRKLKGDVRFLQMNGLIGTGTDPRIKLSIWNLSSQTDRKFLTLPENDHGYVKGDFADILGKKDLIHIIGALCDDTFSHVSSGYDSIDESRKATFGEIEGMLGDEENYIDDCAGVQDNAKNELTNYDIDYCNYKKYLIN